MTSGRFRNIFFLSCPEVGQTEPPPALAFSSVGHGVSMGQLTSGQLREKIVTKPTWDQLATKDKNQPGAGSALSWVSRRLAVVCLRQCRPECSFLELKKMAHHQNQKKSTCTAATAAAARHRSPQWRKHARLHGSYARRGGGLGAVGGAPSPQSPVPPPLPPHVGSFDSGLGAPRVTSRQQGSAKHSFDAQQCVYIFIDE